MLTRASNADSGKRIAQVAAMQGGQENIRRKREEVLGRGDAMTSRGGRRRKRRRRRKREPIAISATVQSSTFHIMNARPTILIALLLHIMSDAAEIDSNAVEGQVAGPIEIDNAVDGQVAGPIEIDSNADDDDVELVEFVQDERFPSGPRIDSTSVWFLLEVFSPPRVAPVFERIAGGTGVSVDVTTGWDANDFSDRAAIWAWMEQNVIEVLIASPPCTMFSVLMASNRPRMCPVEYRRRAAEALGFWRFALDLCRLQQSRGRGFIIEHPVGATSWGDSYLQHLPLAQFSVFDQCRYGLRAPNGQPMQKATRLFSNMPEVAAEFNNKRCNCQEAHAIAQGSMHGQRLSTWAQRYPRPMVQALAACSQAYCQRVFPA